MDPATDEPLSECRSCPDWAGGEQCQKDFDRMVQDAIWG